MLLYLVHKLANANIYVYHLYNDPSQTNVDEKMLKNWKNWQSGGVSLNTVDSSNEPTGTKLGDTFDVSVTDHSGNLNVNDFQTGTNRKIIYLLLLNMPDIKLILTVI